MLGVTATTRDGNGPPTIGSSVNRPRTTDGTSSIIRTFVGRIPLSVKVELDRP